MTHYATTRPATCYQIGPFRAHYVFMGQNTAGQKRFCGRACGGRHSLRRLTASQRFRPSQSVACRFGNQLDQGQWQAERGVPDVRLPDQIKLTPFASSPGHKSSPQEAPQATQERFDWRAQWYPVAVVSDLDPSRPHATKLLGDDFVLMNDESNVWRCLEDKCSHRLAPLSQGRIEPTHSTLMCSYHGWAFNGQGRAVSIPQARFQNPVAEEAACKSNRSCVKAFPTTVREGLLFVWPSPGPEAFIHSAAVQPPGSKVFAQVSPEDVTAEHTMYFQRDFPVPYDIVVENIGDQSHVPFAHHGVAGNRTSNWANHFKLSAVNRDLKQVDGYTYDLEWSPSGFKAPSLQHVSFTPPSLIDQCESASVSYAEYVTPNEPKPSTVYFYITPLDQHTCRVFSHALVCDPIPKPISWLLSKRPRWLDHLVLNEVFDGDMAYLHQTGVIAKNQDSSLDGWARDYFLASEADRSVTAWRRWYHGARGQSGPFKAEGVPLLAPTPLKRADILDRYTQHVKSCPSCSKALRGVRGGQQGLQVALVALLLLLATQLGQGAPVLSWNTAIAAAGATGIVAMQAGLADLEKKFTYKNYDHAK